MNDIIESVINGGKVIILTVGPSGAGKSHFCKEIVDSLQNIQNTQNKQNKQNVSVHSLDDYRIKYNNGKYPSNQKEHDSINGIVIPIYREKVMDDAAEVILLDNTHLKWDPDWQLPLTKAIDQRYDILPIVAPLTI
jgi:ABC-type iron transport system FetAB ATPase subunit